MPAASGSPQRGRNILEHSEREGALGEEISGNTQTEASICACHKIAASSLNHRNGDLLLYVPSVDMIQVQCYDCPNLSSVGVIGDKSCDVAARYLDALSMVEP